MEKNRNTKNHNALLDTYSEENINISAKEVREKLITKGASALSDDELLSIIIHEGNTSGSSLELARKVLYKARKDFGGLTITDLTSLRMIEGLGVKKAAIITAAVELGKRLALEETCNRTTISGNNDVTDMFKPLLGHLPYEEFWVIYLSNANTVIGKAKINQGGAAAIAVEPRIVIKRAIELLASGIILVHNHPSGISEPSPEDIKLTETISAGAKILGMSVIDHVIITSGKCLSFRKEGLIKG